MKGGALGLLGEPDVRLDLLRRGMGLSNDQEPEMGFQE